MVHAWVATLTAAIALGLLLQLLAAMLVHAAIRGEWLKHSGAMLLAMASLYHGITEVQQWISPGRNRTRLQASQESVDAWVVLVSLGLLIYAVGYVWGLRGRPAPSADAMNTDAVRGLSVKWLLLLSAPLVILSIQGRGAVQAAGFTGQPASDNYATAGLATQFLIFTITLTGIVLIARRGGKWLLPWIVLQTVLLSFVGVRSMLVVSAVLVLYGAVRLRISFSMKPLIATGLLLALVAATISSSRAVVGREYFLADRPAADRMTALARGLVALPTAESREAVIDDFVYRFDGNTFGALVGQALDKGAPPVGFVTLKNDLLLTVPSFLNPDKLNQRIEDRNEDAYFVKHFGLNYGTDYLPGLFGFMLGYLGKPGVPVLALLLGLSFAWIDRWQLSHPARSRFLLSFGLMQAVLFYGRLPVGFLLVGRGVVLFVVITGIAAFLTTRRRAAPDGLSS